MCTENAIAFKEKAMINKELLEILVCPACRTKLYEDDDYLQCMNAECRKRYQIVDDIPKMLVEEAIVLEKDIFKQKMKEKEKSEV